MAVPGNHCWPHPWLWDGYGDLSWTRCSKIARDAATEHYELGGLNFQAGSPRTGSG